MESGLLWKVDCCGKWIAAASGLLQQVDCHGKWIGVASALLWQVEFQFEINVKKIAFGNKEHTTDKKMGVSVLLRHFVSSNEVCNTAYTL